MVIQELIALSNAKNKFVDLEVVGYNIKESVLNANIDKVFASTDCSSDCDSGPDPHPEC